MTLARLTVQLTTSTSVSNQENPSIAYFTLFTRELIDKTETPVFQTAKTDLAMAPFERVPFTHGSRSLCACRPHVQLI